MKLKENVTCTEIFQEIGKRQVLALMFHDSMCDLYNFLNLSGFKRWHEHQYLEESKEFLNTKHYFMSAHNRLLDITNTGQPDLVIPEGWYKYSRFDVTTQTIKQYVESSFDSYRAWEEETKHLYEELSKALFDMGYVADSEMVNQLVKDVSEELKEVYSTLLRLKAANFDIVYTLDIQHEFHKKYK